jgi:hypothetical protein
MAIFLFVGAVPVSILEVDAKVLHRLALELGQHGTVNPQRHLGVDTEDRLEVGRFGCPLVGEGESQFAELGHGRRGEELGAPVHGVNGLALGALPGELRANPGGDCLQPPVPGLE